MGKQKIGIGCIGSGVGQSIINSIRLSSLDVKTIGFGNNPFAYGSYDCDEYEYVPSIYEENYICSLIEKCEKYRVDLLIPGLDDEVLLYAKNEAKFKKAGIDILCCGLDLISLCRDKERMSKELSKVAQIFVKTYTQEDIKSGILKFPVIAKPRDGSASKGIMIIHSPDEIKRLPENYIFQEIAYPLKTDPNYKTFVQEIQKGRNSQVSEISIQIVYSREGEMIGRMMSYNKLNNGVPIEILPYENDYVESQIDKIIPILEEKGLRGPLNIQSRLTDEGLKIWEMNPRFTGITGLRAKMGFNEVDACIRNWLGMEYKKINFKNNRFGCRQTEDKSIPIERNSEVNSLYLQINIKPPPKRKTVFITGSTGYIGRNLLKRLEYEDIDVFTEDFDYYANQTDILLHLAFSRPYRGIPQIAKSLEYTQKIFTKACLNNIPAIINISSACVYDSEGIIAPVNIYGYAKYASEQLLLSIGKINKVLRHTSIRLGSVAGGAEGLVDIDVLSSISKNTLLGNVITVFGGDQPINRIDIRDVCDALVVILKSDPRIWKEVYDLNALKTYSLNEIVEKSINIASCYNGGIKSSVLIADNKFENKYFIADSSLFYEDMKWIPKYSIDDTIESLIKYFQNDRI